MKKAGQILVVFILTLFIQDVYAQQDAMYTQYMFNMQAINPAYAGSRNVLSATALLRNQWVGIEGAPKTQTFSIDSPLPDSKAGFGLQIFNDKIGITKTTGAFATYAFRIKMERSTLAFGVQGGFSHYRANYTLVNLNTGGQGDVAFGQDVNQFLPNFGTGVYFNTDRLYLGVSVPHILNNTYTQNTSIVTNQYLARQYIHLFIIGGYVFDLGDDFKLKPSFLFKGVRGAPVEVDLSTNLWIKDVLSIGVSYRTNADVSGLAEIQISPQIRVGYAYDHSITPLVNFNSGSHEIMLRYEFGFEKDKKISPRYF